MIPSPALLAAVARHMLGLSLAAPPEPLTGGNLNHVWRLRSHAGAPLILKHAPPHVAAQPDVPLSPARLAFEARALALFGEGGSFHSLAAPAVRPPRLIHYDPEHHFLLLEDIGPGPDLAAALTAGHLSASVGRALGTFIGRLHHASTGDATLARTFDNRAIQAARLRIQYRAVAPLAHTAGVDAATVARLDTYSTALGKRLLAPGRCLVMGDLWPPSILTAGHALRLIDWEFAHYGHPLQDLAHFGAHCWMQAHTAALPAEAQTWRDLWAAFVSAYCAAAPLSLTDADEPLLCVHAGAEILLRCSGPFMRGYRYEGLKPGDPLVRAAVAHATHLLAAPDLRNKSSAPPSHPSMPLLRFSTLCFAAVALFAPAARAFDHTHAAFDRVLKSHVRDGFVAYAALKAAPAPLDAYLTALAAVPSSEFDGWPEKDRLAFLINLYNAATLRLILDNYPTKSIRSIGWLPGAAWKKEGVSLFGKKISLDEVEHGLIRPTYNEPRAHFALVCAARGCPPLRAEAFVGARLDAQLDEQGRIFLGQTEKNRVDPAKRVLHLSPIFKWFSGDFEAAAGTVTKFVTPFFPESSRTALAAGGADFKIDYTDYDWSLNDQAKK